MIYQVGFFYKAMNNKELEQKEINLLNGKGFEIPIKIFGKERVFKCKKMTLGRMLKLSEVFIQMDLDEKALGSDDFQEQIALQYQTVIKNTKKAVKVISICITDNVFFRWFIERCILKSFDSLQLLDFAQNLLKSANYANFMTSIALMNGNRPTRANPIEKK